MSSPEVERFEITEDDIQNEFNPNRKQFRMTKKKAMLGMWADDDSDEEERPGFGKGKHKKDYSAPIGFVSGGIKQGDKVVKEGQEEDSSDSDSEFDRPLMQQVKYGKKAAAAMGGPSSSYRRKPESGVGHWEKHTKGIGQKLMSKMGFTPGKGLGKNLQGITTPVEAMKRKGKGAVGFHGTERSERSLIDFPVQDGDAEEEKEFMQSMQQWKKPETSERPKKPKYVYKTVDEVIADGSSRKSKQTSSHGKVKVIDMRKKEQRVFTGYGALAHQHDRPEEAEDLFAGTKPEERAFDMPELLHNLDILCDMAEDQIVQNDKRLRHEGDLVVNLKHEKEKLDEVVEQEEKQINRVKELLNVMDDCERRTKPGCEDPMSLEDCATLFKRLQEQYYEEYKLYELSHLAVALVFPMMKTYFENWNPLHSPRHGIPLIKDWKSILEDSSQNFRREEGHLDPYERLMWEIWMPIVRRIVLNTWSVRNSDPLIDMMETWMPLLPGWIFRNILEQLVFPKLQREVENWNPLTDTMPIHAWLHPWLPLMGERLSSLYPPIRNKLANALTNWHPSDPSAKMMLEPWMKVFKPGQMDAFLTKNIVPKLSLCMQEFVINPHQQHLDGWHWVMAWKAMLPLSHMVNILEKNFFHKWLHTLSTWLCSHPNFDEVTKWYMGWKSMFSSDLLSHPAIKNHLNRALEHMNQAVSGNYQPGARENVAYLTHTERFNDFSTPEHTRDVDSPPARSLNIPTTTVPASFKDLIEKKAQENNLVFIPVPNRTYEAKQVYRFGRASIYIDRNVVFCQQTTGQWIPVSLNALVDMGK